jgi:hypothetical protein
MARQRDVDEDDVVPISRPFMTSPRLNGVVDVDDKMPRRWGREEEEGGGANASADVREDASRSVVPDIIRIANATTRRRMRMSRDGDGHIIFPN